jgi:hypothetical protein
MVYVLRVAAHVFNWEGVNHLYCFTMGPKWYPQTVTIEYENYLSYSQLVSYSPVGSSPLPDPSVRGGMAFE